MLTEAFVAVVAVFLLASQRGSVLPVVRICTRLAQSREEGRPARGFVKSLPRFLNPTTGADLRWRIAQMGVRLFYGEVATTDRAVLIPVPTGIPPEVRSAVETYEVAHVVVLYAFAATCAQTYQYTGYRRVIVY